MRDSWGSIISTLKQDAVAHSPLDPKVLSAAITKLGSEQSCDARKEEVGEDLAFLAQLVLRECSDEEQPVGSPQSRVPFCRLMSSVLNGAQSAKISHNAANICCAALRHLALVPHATPSTTQRPHASPPTTPNPSSSHNDFQQRQRQPQQHAQYVLQHEALSALACLLQSCASQVSQHEQAALMALLLSVLQAYSDARAAALPTSTPAASSFSSSNRSSNGIGNSSSSDSSRAPPCLSPQLHADLMESATLALQALSCWLSRPGGASGITPEGFATAQACVLSTLQRCCIGHGRVVEDGPHSRLYALLLRVLGALIPEAKQAWLPHTATLVECCTKFFLYGVQPVPPPPPSSTPDAAVAAAHGGHTQHGRKPSNEGRDLQEQTGRYKPPHLRTATAAKAGGSGGSGSKGRWSEGRGSESGSGSGWSDSEVSDGETGASTNDRFKSSRVRLAVLGCLQAMAKAEPRALHAHWTTLLPVQQPLQPRPLSPHIITMLLHDPVSKVSSMAAATIACLLEGPAQRGFLAVAEARTMASASARAAPARGFLTLSASLGQMVVCLHAGLVHALAVKETAVASLLPMVLRALCVVMSASPYDRLPRQLLPETTAALLERWTSLAASAPAPSLLSDEPRWPFAPTSPTTGAAAATARTTAALNSTATVNEGRSPRGECGGAGGGPQGSSSPGPPLRLGSAAAVASGVGALHAGEALALQVAYLACLAEAFSTRQPQQGMCTYLRALLPPHTSSPSAAAAAAHGAPHSHEQPTPKSKGFDGNRTAGAQQLASVPSAPLQRGGAARCVSRTHNHGEPQGSIGNIPVSSDKDAARAQCTSHPQLQLQSRQPPQLPLFVLQLLQASVCCHPALRIEALAALKGLATHYIFTLPGLWNDLCQVVSINLDAPPATSPHTSPRHAASTNQNTSSTSSVRASQGLINSSCDVSDSTEARGGSSGGAQRGGGRGRGRGGGWTKAVGPGRGGANASGGRAGGREGAGNPGSTSTSSNSNTPEDKAVQHAIKLLAQYLEAQAAAHGHPACPDDQFSEGDTAPAPWRACKLGALPDGSGWAHPELQGWWGAPLTAAAAPSSPSSANAAAHTACPHPSATATAATISTTQHSLAATVTNTTDSITLLPPPAGSCENEWSSSARADVAELQAQALHILAPRATTHPSLMVRAAAFTCLASYAPVPLSSLPLVLLRSTLARCACAVQEDPAAAVRAAACKAVGNIAASSAVLADAACWGSMDLRSPEHSTPAAVGGLASAEQHGMPPDHSTAAVVQDLAFAEQHRGDQYGIHQGCQHGIHQGDASHACIRQVDMSHATTTRHPPHISPQVYTSHACSAAHAACEETRANGQQQQASVSVIDALQKGLHDSVMSVRISASWALANVVDALWNSSLHAPHTEAIPSASCCDHGTSDGGHERAMSTQGEGINSGIRALNIAEGGGRPDAPISDAQQQQQQQQQQKCLLPHLLHQLGRMCEAAEAAAHGDADKVRANGVRAVGGLLGLLDPSTALLAGLDLDRRLESLATCLQSCVTTGNAKVQWMACTAAHALFTNALLQALPQARAPTTSLLLLLIMLVRDSANFKVRTYAAAAVAALPQRALFGGMLTDALLVVCGALEGLQSGSGSSGGGGNAVSGSVVNTSAGGDADGGAARGGKEGSRGGFAGFGESSSQQPAAEGEKETGGGEGGRVFSNFRYVPGLLAQLRATLLHLMALAQAGDGVRARDGLSRRADTLLGAVSEAAKDAAAAVSVTASTSSEVAAAQCLPHDPFEGGASVSSSPGGMHRSGCKSVGAGLLEAVREAVQGWGCGCLHSDGSCTCKDKFVEGGTQRAQGEQGSGHIGVANGLDAWAVQRIARVGAAAAGFVRMCEGVHSNVREQQRAQAESLEQEAREALFMLVG